jgi:hypothetical protein
LNTISKSPPAETIAAPEQPSTPFELSRIYAKGWTAGMGAPVDDNEAAVQQRAETMNPYTEDAARQRWAQGFVEAVRRKCDGPQRKAPRRAPSR